MKREKVIAILTICAMCSGLVACSNSSSEQSSSSGESTTTVSSDAQGPAAVTAATTSSEKKSIEKQLDLSNNEDVTWSYDSSSKSWTMSSTCTVLNPELEDYQGVSVNVPGSYVKGIDTDGDGKADVTAKSYSDAENGTLVIDEDASVTSTNGQVYKASTAPVIINTGAEGYSAQKNQNASSDYASEGYINVACGNRGKQSVAKDSDGNAYYSGDAPLCLVDQKNAIRFVKYNILLGNLPGSVDYFVSTGGSGGGAHAVMVAATSNNSEFFDYEIEAGAVGVYRKSSDKYSTSVSLDGKNVEISDGVWGCIGYSPITSLAESDMALAFEYYLDPSYEFNTDFQQKTASYLAKEYRTYINNKKLTASESEVGFDLNKDGDKNDTVRLTIDYDKDKYAKTNGYGGTYLTLYLNEFEQNLNWYLDNLDYAEDWTWFDDNGNAFSDKKVAAMSAKDKAEAFLEGRYAKGSSENSGGPGGGNMPSGNAPEGKPSDNDSDNSDAPKAGTPDAGTTQSASSSTDSSNYSSYDEMLEAYQTDIDSIEEGDKYGKNIVDLYNPLNFIGDEDTDGPVWTRIMMGASEGDESLFASMNLQLAWQNAGTNAELDWQWDGGHVPSEILGNSFSLYVDQMYGKYVKGAKTIQKSSAKQQTENGDADEASGTDISSWVTYKNGKAKFSLAKAAEYRTSGASKAMPGFDVIDYGQETYEFGKANQDARHFDKYVLNVFKKHSDTLSDLFNN